MQSKIPLPTDNIFKFYALFGLVLVIFGFSAIIYLNKTTNDLIFDTVLKIEVLESSTDLSSVQETELIILERKQEIAITDKDGFVFLGAFLIGIGVVLMVIGFYHWHTKIQPLQDKILELTIKKLEQELSTSNNAFKRSSNKNKTLY